jgi:hypothetical protein
VSSKEKKKKMILHTIVAKLLGDLQHGVRCVAARHCCKTLERSAVPRM